MVAVVGQIDFANELAIAIHQPDKRDHRVLVDGDLFDDRLRPIRGDRAVVTGTAIVEEDVAVLRPEFVPDGILLLLPEAGARLVRDEVQKPDALRHQIPGSLMAERPQRRIDRRKLEMPDLMRILEHVERARTIQIG